MSERGDEPLFERDGAVVRLQDEQYTDVFVQVFPDWVRIGGSEAMWVPRERVHEVTDVEG